jgi:cytochrome c553
VLRRTGVTGVNVIRESLFAAMLAVPASVSSQVPDATAVAAREKAPQTAETLCAACHGPRGNSALPANPNLAGQDAGYIARQLHAFKSGARVNEIMKAMAAALTDEDMAALGAYYARQASGARPAAVQPPGTQAQTVYLSGDEASGLPACAACHAPDGRGTTTYYPRLAGQHAEYLHAQLKSFKSGTRGKDGRDAQGRIMWAVAQRLGDAQMQPLAEYLSALRSAP